MNAQTHPSAVALELSSDPFNRSTYMCALAMIVNTRFAIDPITGIKETANKINGYHWKIDSFIFIPKIDTLPSLSVSMQDANAMIFANGMNASHGLSWL